MNHDYNPNSVDSKLTSIETKLDQALAAREDHEKRLINLERWRYYILGAVAAVGGALKAFDWLTTTHKLP